jgi:hypothetical protein
MDLEDALFEDMQALSDDAEALGLTDVALVLEFAMDVYLRQTGLQSTPDTTASNAPVPPSPPLKSRHTPLPVMPDTSGFLLAQVYRHAS